MPAWGIYLHLLDRRVVVGSLWVTIAVQHLGVPVHMTSHCEKAQTKKVSKRGRQCTGAKMTLTLGDGAIPAPEPAAELSEAATVLVDVVAIHDVQTKADREEE